eukprot:gene2230-2543_t
MGDEDLADEDDAADDDFEEQEEEQQQEDEGWENTDADSQGPAGASGSLGPQPADEQQSDGAGDAEVLLEEDPSCCG